MCEGAGGMRGRGARVALRLRFYAGPDDTTQTAVPARHWCQKYESCDARGRRRNRICTSPIRQLPNQKYSCRGWLVDDSIATPMRPRTSSVELEEERRALRAKLSAGARRFLHALRILAGSGKVAALVPKFQVGAFGFDSNLSKSTVALALITGISKIVAGAQHIRNLEE